MTNTFEVTKWSIRKTCFPRATPSLIKSHATFLQQILNSFSRDNRFTQDIIKTHIFELTDQLYNRPRALNHTFRFCQFIRDKVKTPFFMSIFQYMEILYLYIVFRWNSGVKRSRRRRRRVSLLNRRREKALEKRISPQNPSRPNQKVVPKTKKVTCLLTFSTLFPLELCNCLTSLLMN